MLPALTLGIFAVPGAASADNGGTSTDVRVTTTNMAVAGNFVGVVANTGGNTVLGASVSKAGDSGDVSGLTSSARATATSDADADADADGEEKSDDTEADADAAAENKLNAHSGTYAATGDGGTSGDAITFGAIDTGNAAAGLVVMNDLNATQVDIEVTDDCDCERYNEYYERASDYFTMSKESEWSKYEDESEHGKDGETDITDESASSASSMTKEGDWEVYEKTFVPVRTSVDVTTRNASFVMNGGEVVANSGDNLVGGMSMTAAGDSGDVSGLSSSADVDAHSKADADADADGEEGSEDVDADANAWALNDLHSKSETAGTTGNGGTSGDSTTEGVIVTGHTIADAAIVNISNRGIVRIVR
jgi:hypothetical protein